MRVSAHVLIDRDGKTTQFVSFDHRAWHAGVSACCGRAACNDFSVGIELEGTDFESFTDAQYRSLNAVIGALLAAYPIGAVQSATPTSRPIERPTRVRFSTGVEFRFRQAFPFPRSDFFSETSHARVFDALRNQLLLSFENSAHMMRTLFVVTDGD